MVGSSLENSLRRGPQVDHQIQPCSCLQLLHTHTPQAPSQRWVWSTYHVLHLVLWQENKVSRETRLCSALSSETTAQHLINHTHP